VLQLPNQQFLATFHSIQTKATKKTKIKNHNTNAKMQTNYLATLRANSLRANAFNRLAASRRCASMLSVIKTLFSANEHSS